MHKGNAIRHNTWPPTAKIMFFSTATPTLVLHVLAVDTITQYVYWVDGKLGTVSHNSAMKSADQCLLQ